MRCRGVMMSCLAMPCWRCLTGALMRTGLAIIAQASIGPAYNPPSCMLLTGPRCTRCSLALACSSLKRAQRDRAAVLAGAGGAADTDPLLALASERLLDRLEDCTRRFPTTAVIGGAGGQHAFLGAV